MQSQDLTQALVLGTCSRCQRTAEGLPCLLSDEKRTPAVSDMFNYSIKFLLDGNCLWGKFMGNILHTKWREGLEVQGALCKKCPKNEECPHKDSRAECWEYDEAVKEKK